MSHELDRETKIKIAYAMLKGARQHLKEAKAHKTLRRVRHAISSVKGAIRSAEHDQYRMERKGAA